MYDDKISTLISNIPISFLEPLQRNELLENEDLFLVSQPVHDNDPETGTDTHVGYVSKSVSYRTLADSLSSSIGIPGILERID